MLSCLHGLRDDRIYWKEALSLQKAGYNVIHIGVGLKKVDCISTEGIRLIQLTRTRYFRNNLIDKIFRKLSFRRDIVLDILEAAGKTDAAVFHFHDLQINKIGPLLKKLPQHPKVIYDVHESYEDLIRDHSPWFLKPFNYLYASYIHSSELKKARHYDAIITTDKYVWQKFQSSMPGKICEIIYNYSFFTVNPQETRATPKKYDAIYSGSISKVRGIYEILYTVKLLKLTIPSVKVIVIGNFINPRLKKRILQLITSNCLTSNLILHDSVPFEEIGTFYRSSKTGLCIFHPIKLHKNAVFIKTFEYMAFGLPIIASNFGTIANYIKETNTGTLVEPLKPFAIANAILYLLNHPDVYETYSLNGIESVKKEYTWEREEKKIISLYQTLLDVPQ